MFSIDQIASVAQLRCLPFVAGTGNFQYVVMVNGIWEPINHIQVVKIVEQKKQASELRGIDHG